MGRDLPRRRLFITRSTVQLLYNIWVHCFVAYTFTSVHSARSVGNLGTGTYELFAETGRITGTGATNEFYFPQAISMVGGYFYIMAIVQYGGTVYLPFIYSF